MGRKRKTTDRRNLSVGQPPAVERVAPRRGLRGQLAVLLAVGLIVLVALAAYSNSFHGPFVFDDEASIPGNPTIRHLWPISGVLSPPPNGETVSGRPLLNLSLAVNYALGATEVWGYHATNLAIHVLVGLLLFGVVRRTLLLRSMRERWGDVSTWIALAAALIWIVHPLQTESVTYIVQRAEALGALFYLLTLYCAIRGVESARASLWCAGSVLACLLGMATKEVMATAPIVVLLYDYTFLSGSPSHAMRRRLGLYLGLAATWGLLVYLVASTGLLVQTETRNVPDMWSYARSQAGVILYYLRLCAWPYPQCLEYGWPVARGMAQIVPAMVMVGSLVALSAWGLVRRRGWAFLGASFFLILAPTSSILPLAQLAFEHRLYLPLAAVVVLAVAGVYLAGQSLVRRGAVQSSTLKWAAVGLVTSVTLVLAIATYSRNQVYATEFSIWQDTLSKSPHNARVNSNVGVALFKQQRLDEAIKYFRESLAIDPRGVPSRNGLAAALAQQGHLDEAIEQFKLSLEVNSRDAATYYNLGTALLQQGHLGEAAGHFRSALELEPHHAQARMNLGLILARQGKLRDTLTLWRDGIQLAPNDAALLSQTAWLLAVCPDTSLRNGNEAVALAQRAVALSGRHEPKPFDVLAAGYAVAGRFPEAIEAAQTAISLAMAQGNAALAREIQSRLTFYESQRQADGAKAQNH